MAARRGRRGRRPEPREVTIDSMSHEGRGIAHVNGKTVFVFGALQGEKVRMQVLKSSRKFDQATTLEVIEASPQRIEARFVVALDEDGEFLRQEGPFHRRALKLDNLFMPGKIDRKCLDWLATCAQRELNRTSQHHLSGSAPAQRFREQFDYEATFKPLAAIPQLLAIGDEGFAFSINHRLAMTFLISLLAMVFAIIFFTGFSLVSNRKSPVSL